MSPGIVKVIQKAEECSGCCHPGNFSPRHVMSATSTGKARRRSSKMMLSITRKNSGAGMLDDVTLESDHDDYSSLTATPNVETPQAFLERIRRLTDHYHQQQILLQQNFQLHKEKCEVRYLSQNYKSAILSVKLMKRMQLQKDQVCRVLEYLRTLQMDLEIPSEGMDMSLFPNFEAEIEKITQEQKSSYPSEQDLLKEARALFSGEEK